MFLVNLKKYSSLFVHHLFSGSVLIVITFVFPIVFLSLVLLQIYRQFVAQLLAFKYGQNFRGLLEGPDVVWAGEIHSSKAMVNALFLFANAKDSSNFPSELLQEFRQRVDCHLHNAAYRKMFWELRYQWGYFFWLHRPILPVDYYVKQLDQIPTKNKCLTRRELCNLIGSISNRNCTGTTWELLVGTQPVSSEKSDVKLYPVLFRYHHSISDGIALLRSFYMDFIDEGATTTYKRLNVWNTTDATPTTIRSLISGRFLLKLVLTAPRFLLYELLLKQEKNSLHHGIPGEDKITSWVSEDISAPFLISTLKKVKVLLPGVRFTDIFLMALAMSIHSYCDKYGLDVPASLTVAVMRRFECETGEIRLRNRSSPVLQTLPVGNLPITGHFSTNASISELLLQILAVKRYSDTVHASTDPVITYLSVSKLPSLLPAPIVIPLLARSKFSIGMSNIPAFDNEVTVGGYASKDAIFWVPNVGVNMLGLSLLTVNNRLQLGMIADRKIISSLDKLDTILEGTMWELRSIENILNRSIT